MEKRGTFGSKLAIVLATAGSAVGLGNIWRFPFMTGHNGGAAFILVYFACVFLLGIPGMISEFIVGRHAQTNAARAYSVMGGKGWRFVGYLGILTSTIILGFYAVVAGWCLQYLTAALSGRLLGDPDYIVSYFKTFSSDPLRPCLWAVGFVLITHFVVSKGVNDGIERASKLLMPLLLIILLVLVAASCLLPGAGGGIEFLLKPDFSKVSKDVFLEALGQAFFSLSLGTSCLCTYASYFKRDTNLLRSATQIALLDSFIAILAGLMIFPAAFSVGVQPDSGPSLIFITLPNVFQQAFSSMPIAGAWVLTVVCSLLAVFCSLSVGAYSGIQLFGLSLMDFCDMLTAQLMLPAGAFLTSIMMGWFVSRQLLQDEFTNQGSIGVAFYHAYMFAIRYIVPLCILLIFLHQLDIL